MPDLSSTFLNQTATYWAATGKVDNYGVPTHENPVEIEVNWNENKSLGGQKNGTQGIDASITSDVEIKVGSLLWLGEEDEWYGTGSANYDTELMIVQSVKWSSDCRGRDDIWVAQLKRCKDLPNV